MDQWYSRTQHAEAKAVQAGESAELARDEAKIARTVAKELAPDYHQPGINIFTAQILKNFEKIQALNIYVRLVVSMIMMIKKKLFKWVI